MNAETALRTQRILYAGLIGSVAMYGGVLWVLLSTLTSAGQPPGPLLPALAMAALSTVVAMVVLRRRLLPPMREAHSLTEASAADSATDARAVEALRRLQVALVVSWALCESIALFGFVLSFLSRDFRYYTWFAVPSLACFVWTRPQEEMLRAVLRASAHGDSAGSA